MLLCLSILMNYIIFIDYKEHLSKRLFFNGRLLKKLCYSSCFNIFIISIIFRINSTLHCNCPNLLGTCVLWGVSTCVLCTLHWTATNTSAHCWMITASFDSWTAMASFSSPTWTSTLMFCSERNDFATSYFPGCRRGEFINHPLVLFQLVYFMDRLCDHNTTFPHSCVFFAYCNQRDIKLLQMSSLSFGNSVSNMLAMTGREPATTMLYIYVICINLFIDKM